VPDTVHVVRHGEVFNPGRILYGRLPGYRLSDLGVAQAEVTAQFLAARPIGYLVSSPLERARQTAAPLAELTGLPVDTDERLLEAENLLQGRAVAGGRGLLRDPRVWPHLLNPFRPSWGEPYERIAARMIAALQSACERIAGTGSEAVCVTHQLPIVIARRRAEGRALFHDPRRRQCALASVTSFTFAGGRIAAVDYQEPAAAVLPQGTGTGA
jgi:broad specificity phosphatase PhoE